MAQSTKARDIFSVKWYILREWNQEIIIISSVNFERKIFLIKFFAVSNIEKGLTSCINLNIIRFFFSLFIPKMANQSHDDMPYFHKGTQYNEVSVSYERHGWVRALLCISKFRIVINALYKFAMHGTCYIRNVVPCGLGHRLIVSRGRRYIYEFNDGKMIDGYSYTVVTDILRMQRWGGDTPAAPIFIYFSFPPLKSCTLV